MSLTMVRSSGIMASVCLLASAVACTGQPSNVEIQPAPIHEVTINFLKTNPVQVSVHIKLGLRDTCTRFHDIKHSQSGTTITITVTTERETNAICGQVYTFLEKDVNLGSKFTSGQTYTVKVNDMTTTFVMP